METILVFALVVFDSILILNLVMPKINSISVVWCGVILKILCKFQSIVYSPVLGQELSSMVVFMNGKFMRS